MALDIDISHYNTGTATIAAGGTAVTGQGTTWTVLRAGDMFGTHVGDGVRILSVDGNAALTLAHPWPGAAQTAAAYEIQRTPYDIGYLVAIEDLLRRWGGGNVDALAGLMGSTGQIPVFTGPGAMSLVSQAELTNGLNTDAKAEDLAGRTAYDAQAAGYSVLVADVGDGRSAIYFKLSAASGDWSAAAYLTGPTGATGATGATGPSGVVPRGAYAAGTLYAINDIVSFNGSSFRKLTTAAAGSAPSSAVPPVDTVDWQVFAARGVNGSGTGDVVGPASSIDDSLTLYSGTTGKQIKDSGIAVGRLFTYNGALPTTPHSLDDYRTNAWYYQASTAGGTIANGYPAVSAGFLEVLAGQSNRTIQRYTTLGAAGSVPILYQRFYTTAWSAWTQVNGESGSDAIWRAQPIGTPIPIFAHLFSSVAAALPPTDRAYRYVQLTAGLTGTGAYNNGVLTSESVSGSAPLVVATAQISLTGSPLIGATVNLINTESRYIVAGATAGNVRMDQMQQITGGFTNNEFISRNAPSGTGAITVTGTTAATVTAGSTAYFRSGYLFDSAGSPGARVGSDTHGKDISAIYVMRVL